MENLRKRPEYSTEDLEKLQERIYAVWAEETKGDVPTAQNGAVYIDLAKFLKANHCSEILFPSWVRRNKKFEEILYTVTKRDLPLHINDNEDPTMEIIVKWRIEIGK